MVTTLVPVAIFFGAATSAALAFFAFFGSVHSNATETFGRFGLTLDRAGIRTKPEQLVFTWLTATSVVWILLLFVFKPPILVGFVMVVVAAAIAAGGFGLYVTMQLSKRTTRFLDQFEVVLRLMASGMRSGLGLQQTLNMVIQESAEPAKYEFSRVLGQANIGTSIYDAFDDLAMRIQASETLMMSRVVRINSQTGGDLARVLEQLANTIRERRRMRRKISSLTAEGRLGAIVLGGVPIFLGAFILLTQADMSHGLLFLNAGHIVLGIVIVLEALGIFSLNRILKVAV